MDILLTDLKGTTHVWRVNPTDTIEQLQERYNDFDKSDQDRQLSFIYAGRLLEQNKTLGSYGIVKFSRIHAMYQIKGGAREYIISYIRLETTFVIFHKLLFFACKTSRNTMDTRALMNIV